MMLKVPLVHILFVEGLAGIIPPSSNMKSAKPYHILARDTRGKMI